jgi:hypothetical protein
MSPRFRPGPPLLTAVVALSTLSGPAVPGAAATAAAPVFSVHDPVGDDAGDGTLVYPSRGDLMPGDLDLVSFAARLEKSGTVFEATFARPIRVADRRPVDAAGVTLDRLARFGLYTLNLDVYVDRDRVAGSGRTAMLPGRRAEVDSATAWERAICVTPRPHEARAALVRMRLKAARDSLERTSPRVDREDVQRLELAIEAEIDSTILFPTRITVTGRTLRFFVPAAFLGGQAQDAWAYAVAVSGADLLQRVDLRLGVLGGPAIATGLMILPVAPGRPEDRFGGGRENDALQPPLVDVLIAPQRSQADALKDYDRHTQRPARLRGVVPAEVHP